MYEYKLNIHCLFIIFGYKLNIFIFGFWIFLSVIKKKKSGNILEINMVLKSNSNRILYYGFKD